MRELTRAEWDAIPPSLKERHGSQLYLWAQAPALATGAGRWVPVVVK